MAERTIVVFKPDSVERGLVGDILSRFERAGLRIVGSKTLTVTEEFVSHHYPDKTDFLRSMGVKSLENYAEAGLDPFKEIGTDDPVEIGRNIRKWSMEFLSRGLLYSGESGETSRPQPRPRLRYRRRSRGRDQTLVQGRRIGLKPFRRFNSQKR